MAGDGAIAAPQPLNFNCRKNFLVVEKFSSKIQNMGLKIPIFVKFMG